MQNWYPAASVIASEEWIHIFLCQMDSKRMFLQEKKLNLLYFSISSPRPLRFTAVPSRALLHIKMVMITKKLQHL